MQGYPQHFPHPIGAQNPSPDPMLIESEDLFFTAMNPHPSSQVNPIGMTPAIEIQAIENLRIYVDQGLSTASSIVSSEETGKSSEEELKSNHSVPREVPKRRKRKTNRKTNVPSKIMIKRPQEHETQATGCRCKRSKCKKNYCECIDQGVACGEGCGCNGCGNREAKDTEKKHQGEILFKKVKVE